MPAHQPVSGPQPRDAAKRRRRQIEPEVSDPSANGTRPAATALADPLEDPPDQRVRSHGFSPGPNSDALAMR